MATESHKADSLGKYLLVYVCILAIAGLQFVVAYQPIDKSRMLVRMLSLAIVEAGLGVMFFMHLWQEKRGFLWFVAIIAVFVLAAMNYSWPDSFRMLVGAPFSK